MTELRGKTILLTGASTGLGPHIARRLAREGANFVLSARNEEAMRKLSGELGGGKIITADLSRAGEPERLAAEAGVVDILIANAGLPATGRLATFSVEEIDRALDVNLRSAMVLARLVVPPMLERHSGHLLFMSSIAGHAVQGGESVYHATKYAIRGFALSLREEMLNTGVGVSVVCPTFVSEAGMWAETGLKPDPIAGEVTPAQVAEAVRNAIVHNRAEIDVMPLPLKASLKVQALAPGLFTAVARSRGATRPNDEQDRRQRNKR